MNRLVNDKGGRVTRYPLAIISAHYGGACNNEDRHSQLLYQLKRIYNLDCGVVEGMYKGQREKSILVELAKDDAFAQVAKLAREFEQESILLISTERQASLYYPASCEVVRLGKIEPISPTKARLVDSWTRTDNGQYYTTE